MTSTPRAVAICPTADRAQYLPLALDCFARQTYPAKKLVVLDNGVNPVELLLAMTCEVEYVQVPPKKFPHGQLMNICCKFASRGDVIFAWDDDDWSAPNRMQDQIDRLVESGKSVTGYHNLLFYNMLDGKTYKYLYNGPGMYASGTTQCFTQEFWKRNSFPDKSKGADGDFSKAAQRQGQLISVPGVGMMVARSHSDSTSPPQLGSRQFPACSRDNFPRHFFEDLERLYAGQPTVLETPRALIAILSCHEYADRRQFQRSTWIQRLPKHFDYRFFVGEPFTSDAEDEVCLPVPDDYDNLPLKTRAMCKWAYQRGYDSVFKIDDDTFVMPDRLVKPDADYTGHLRINPPHNDGVNYARGGCGYWLSRRSLQCLIDAPELLKPGIEDGLVGKALLRCGIAPHNDARYEAAPHNVPNYDNDTITAHCPNPELMTTLNHILTSNDNAS
jgi:glycosyltransferase involved in cell wall biosynthesis